MTEHEKRAIEKLAAATRKLVFALDNRDGQAFMHRDASLQSYWTQARAAVAGYDAAFHANEGEPV